VLGTVSNEIRDILARIEQRVGALEQIMTRLNEEVKDVQDEVKSLRGEVTPLAKSIERINERTKIMERFIIALLVGVYGSLISIILVLITQLFHL